MKRALIIYWSATGNTKKVAESVHLGLSDAGWAVTQKTVDEADGEDFYAYDLVCFGVPSYNWLPPKPAQDYLRRKFTEYKSAGKVVPGAPKIPGKNALIFCTYSGPHTGVREAIPAVKYVGQFFEHFGFEVADEWYILSEFVSSVENSTLGRMGDIRGLPNEDDLIRIRSSAVNLAQRL